MALSGPLDAAYPPAPQGEMDRVAISFQFQHTSVCELLSFNRGQKNGLHTQVTHCCAI